MNFDCAFSWETSDVVALLSFLAALWAADIARRALKEAKRANHLTKYQAQRAVYDAFLQLSMHMTQKGQAPDMQTVGQFYQHVHTAPFCFDEKLATKLADYYDAAFKVADFARVNPGMPKLEPVVQGCLDKVHALSQPLLQELKTAIINK